MRKVDVYTKVGHSLDFSFCKYQILTLIMSVCQTIMCRKTVANFSSKVPGSSSFSKMIEADFEEKDFEIVRNIVSHVGLGHVKAFGITWEDCENFLSQLGYRLSVKVSSCAVSH